MHTCLRTENRSSSIRLSLALSWCDCTFFWCLSKEHFLRFSRVSLSISKSKFPHKASSAFCRRRIKRSFSFIALACSSFISLARSNSSRYGGYDIFTYESDTIISAFLREDPLWGIFNTKWLKSSSHVYSPDKGILYFWKFPYVCGRFKICYEVSNNN